MSFDPRSLDRLRELGRRLPQPLPVPTPPATQKTTAEPRRHKVETEDNPEQLFRELIQASADGTVPPHLLDRLRMLESRPAHSAAAASTEPPPTNQPGSSRQGRPKGRRPAAATGGDGDLYTMFQQLLLEEDDA